MIEGRTNKHGGPCSECGGWVAAEEGELHRAWSDDRGDYAWRARHRGECPPPCTPRKPEDVAPAWGVPVADGLTEGGNRASGYAVHESRSQPEGAVALNEHARMVAKADEDEGVTGRAWLALAELEGWMPKRRSIEELDEALEHCDLAEMRKRVEAEKPS